MSKASDNIFPKIIESMQTTDPAAPSDSSWKIYAKAGGIYARSSNAIVGAFGAAGAAGSSILLASKSYASGGALVQTSATLGDADSTNLAVTFTVPASGAVIVRLTGSVYMASGTPSGNRPEWGLRESTSVIAGPTFMAYVQTVLGANLIEGRSMAYYISGLTPAASKTYKWAIGGGGSNNGGVYVASDHPILMEVWSA